MDVSVYMIRQFDALISLQQFPYDFHAALGDFAERTHFRINEADGIFLIDIHRHHDDMVLRV